MKKKNEKDTVCLRIERNNLKSLKELARKISYEKNMDVYFPDLVREAIAEYLERRKK